MLKKIILNNICKSLLLIYIINSVINSANSMQQHNNFPKNIQILYTSNLGVNVSMNFKIYDNSYYIDTKLNIPLYKIQYISTGTISNDGVLDTINFTDKRNNKDYSIAKINNKNHQIYYGKVNELTKDNVNCNIYDPFSFAWQFAFNKNVFTHNIKITNGKKLYDLNALSINELKKLITNQTIITSKKNNPLQLNNLQFENIKSTNFNNFNFSLAKNFYNIPIITSFNIQNKNYNLNVNKIIIDNKIVWNIEN